MAEENCIVRNKTTIVEIISTDYLFILNKVQEKDLITPREYNNLKDINKGSMEEHAIRLVDTLVNKGRQGKLREVLQDKEVLANLPRLASVKWKACCSTASTEELDVPKSKDLKTEDQYPLSKTPLCVIINNLTFQDDSKRVGSEKDSESLTNEFSRLGFQVLRCQDQTKSGMAQVLEQVASLDDLAALQRCGLEEWSAGEYVPLRKLPSNGDALVCCLLSHGKKGVVDGVDGLSLQITDITAAFDGHHCQRLVQKPKVFFIQACQGSVLQPGVALDDLAAPEVVEEVEEVDGPPVNLIPVEADFLVAVSSVEKYQSVRNELRGSWFIQSLCKRLKEGSLRGDDIMQILYCVNDDVSQKVCHQNGIQMKQMPEVRKVTLRRKLVFSSIGSP